MMSKQNSYVFPLTLKSQNITSRGLASLAPATPDSRFGYRVYSNKTQDLINASKFAF